VKVRVPQFPFGAVYFRKSNPPRDDWERDYATASEDGMNVFRHWFLWGAIETAPGVYDWEDYDRQLELGARYGVRAIIAEMMISAPEWLYALHPEGRYATADGVAVASSMGASSATGGYPGLCLDCAAVRDLGGRFLAEMARRYRGHEGLLGYDVNNECHYRRDCHCVSTRERFRAWLRAKYGDLAPLAKAWRRYSYTDWAQVEPPRTLAPYPECLDWLAFRKDAFYEDMQWRIDLIRGIDPDALISAHGEASSLNNYALGGSDEWRAAAKVESYGLTYVQERHTAAAWKQMQAVDLVRAGCRGKPFWHAEFQGGPVWINPFSHTKLAGRPREDGRVVSPADVRIWSLTSMCGGATGILSPRWRSLLDGPLFGAYGFYGNDGSRGPRSAMASRLAKWANAPEQAGLFARSRPVKGDIGLLVTDETLALKFLLGQGVHLDACDEALSGAYRGFFDNGIQADWVLVDDIAGWDFLYYAYPVMLTDAHAAAITSWVEGGGTLVCQGLPGYFDERCRVGTVQPGLGFDRLFGAREDYVELLPDLADDVVIEWEGRAVRGGLYTQAYAGAGGEVRGTYAAGGLSGGAIVERRAGRGRTLLFGTYPSVSYFRAPSEENRRFFADVLAWAGVEPRLRVSRPEIVARLFEGDGGRYLWRLTPTRADLPVSVSLRDAGEARVRRLVWGEREVVASGAGLQAIVPAEDALIAELG
jgi:beta-galactosidase